MCARWTDTYLCSHFSLNSTPRLIYSRHVLRSLLLVYVLAFARKYFIIIIYFQQTLTGPMVSTGKYRCSTKISDVNAKTNKEKITKQVQKLIVLRFSFSPPDSGMRADEPWPYYVCNVLM